MPRRKLSTEEKKRVERVLSALIGKKWVWVPEEQFHYYAAHSVELDAEGEITRHERQNHQMNGLLFGAVQDGRVYTYSRIHGWERSARRFSSVDDAKRWVEENAR